MVPGERAGVAHREPVAVGGRLEVDDDVDVGPVPLAVVSNLLVVEEEAADVAQGIGSALGGTAGRLGVAVGGRLLCHSQGGEQHLAGARVEVAVGAHPAVEGARRME